MALLIVFTLTLQILRVFVPSLVFVFGGDESVTTSQMAQVFLVVLLGTFLGALPIPRGRTFIRLASVVLGCLWFGILWTKNSGFQLWGSAAALFVAALLFPTLLLRKNFTSNRLGSIFLCGIYMDAFLHGVFGTQDFFWQWTPQAILIQLALGLGLVFFAIRESKKPLVAFPSPSILSLITLGFGLFSFQVLFLNQARLQVALGEKSSLALPLLLLPFIIATGLLMSLKRVGPLKPPVQLSLVLLLGASLFLCTAFPTPSGVVVGATALTLLIFVSQTVREKTTTLSALQSAWSLALTFLAALSILYYISYDAPIPVSQIFLLQLASGIIILTAVLSVWRSSRLYLFERNWIRKIHFGAIGAVFIAVGWGASFPALKLTSLTNGPEVPAEQKSLKVLSWNIQQGFSAKGRQALTEQADLITRTGAQIVSLQEVARGWLTGGRPDTADILSRRTGMPHVFAGAADPIWGNAILTSLPVIEKENGFLPMETSYLKRGYLRAHLNWNGRHLWVINTHFHHVEESEEGDRIREVQAKAFVEEAWRHDQSVIVMGDFNAKPDSDTIRYLLSAGLHDGFFRDPGHTFRSDRPDRRIDYIFTSQDLEVKDLSIVDTVASDHKAVLAEIQWKEKH